MATMSELKATTTARERVEAAVAKAQASQPRLNAVVTFVDVEDQLAALDTIPDGPFHGMPVVLKDNVCTRGVRTTASSKILDNYVPVYNAHIVDKLKAAGAVVIAKASMDELAMGGTNLTAATGPVYNPYDRTRMAGGSSGGSAALVAACRSVCGRLRYRGFCAQTCVVLRRSGHEADLWPDFPLRHHSLFLFARSRRLFHAQRAGCGRGLKSAGRPG